MARKIQDESFQECVCCMLELASHAEIETKAKIQYIIEGIPDDESNKSILYGASIINEFPKRLAQYEIQRTVMRNKTKDKPAGSKPKRNNRENADTKIKHCYNCGNKDHVGRECSNKSKGMKCFSCGEFDYAAAKYFKEAGISTKTAFRARVEVTNANDRKRYKLVNVLGKDVEMITDSGAIYILLELACTWNWVLPRLTLKPYHLVAWEQTGYVSLEVL